MRLVVDGDACGQEECFICIKVALKKPQTDDAVVVKSLVLFRILFLYCRSKVWECKVATNSSYCGELHLSLSFGMSL